MHGAKGLKGSFLHWMRRARRTAALLLWLSVMLSVVSFTARAEEGEIPLTWEEYVASHQIQAWNWNDAADAIEAVVVHAEELYAAGEKDEAYEYAKATYWGYYETTGFERNTLTRISGSRVSEVELAFTNFRKSIKKDQGMDEVQRRGNDLVAFLHEDALFLSPEGALLGGGGDASGAAGNADGGEVSDGAASGEAADQAGADSSAQTQDAASQSAAAQSTPTGGGAVAIFLGSFAIILREGLEAILIVGAIIAYLVKSGNKKGVVPVYIGSAFAIVCSFVMAGILNYLLSVSAEYHMSQEIVEGVAALTAVVVLFYVSNWMISKSESAAWTSYIASKASGGADRGSLFTLGFTAWLAVFREGAEVILFYQPMLSEDRPDMVWMGFITGVAVLVVVFALIRFLSIRMPIKPFFLCTSILMAVMCISFLGAGIKELIEGGVFDDFEWVIASPVWLSWIPYNDTLDVLGIYPLVGTIVPQLILTVITIITFAIQMRRNREFAAQKAAEAAASEGGEGKKGA